MKVFDLNLNVCFASCLKLAKKDTCIDAHTHPTLHKIQTESMRASPSLQKKYWSIKRRTGT